MILRRMTAVFGKLNGEVLELGAGLNIVTLPNEGGKSTWCAFLRAMLYGISTRERDRDGYIAEKNRYQPWSGRPPEGEIDLIWNGREITLRRSSKPNAPFGVFEAVYTGSADPVPGLTRETVGELLTGVPREVFERTAFLGQGMMTVTAAPELERRCAALLLSGEEDVSHSEAAGRLRNWRNARQSNTKTGAIPKLELERTAVREALSRLETARGRAGAARAELERLRERQTALERDLSAHRQAVQAERRARYDRAVTELQSAEAAEAALPPQAEPVPEPPRQAARGRRELVIAAAVLLALSLFNLFRAVTAPNLLWWIGAGLTAVCAGVALLLSRSGGARAAAEAERARQHYEAALRQRAEQESAHAAARTETARARAVVETMERDGVPEAATAAPPTQGIAAETESEYRRTAADAERSQRDLAAAQGEMRAIGDPAELEGRVEELRGQIAALKDDYDALTLAMECLDSAGDAVRERFSPRLNAEAGRLFAKLTGGAWSEVTLTRAFAARATEQGGLIPRSVSLLSRGTADQLYLAVRLALCDLTLDAKVPVILDDALSAFDDARLAIALGVLASLERQVVLFSCQERERSTIGRQAVPKK